MWLRRAVLAAGVVVAIVASAGVAHASGVEVMSTTADPVGYEGYCDLVENGSVSVAGGSDGFASTATGEEMTLGCNVSQTAASVIASWTDNGNDGEFASNMGIPGGASSYYGCYAGTGPKGSFSLSGQVFTVKMCITETNSASPFPNPQATYVTPATGSFPIPTSGSVAANCSSAQNLRCDRPVVSGNTVGAMFVEGVSSGTLATWGTATFPPDYFEGGTPGTGFIPATPTPAAPTCSRNLHAQVGSGSTATAIADFSETDPAPPPGVTASVSWDFGDGATATGPSPSHTYAMPEPANGWTATETLSWTGDGTRYTTTPVETATCALRLDWVYPDQTQAGSAGASGTSSDTSGCPSGWGWPDPSNIGNMLTCLFVPSSSALSSWAHLWDSAQTKAPISLFSSAGSWLTTTVSELEISLGDGPSPSVSPNGVGCGGGPGWINDPAHGIQAGLPCALLTTGQSNWGSIGWIAQACNAILTIVVYVGAGFGLWRLVAKTVG